MAELAVIAQPNIRAAIALDLDRIDEALVEARGAAAMGNLTALNEADIAQRLLMVQSLAMLVTALCSARRKTLAEHLSGIARVA